MNDKQKDILFYGLVILAIYFAYKIVKGILSIGAPPAGTTTGGTAQNQPVNTANISWPMASFASFADEIEQAVWGGLDVTEDDEAIGQVLSMMNTKDDVQQLINTYGVRGEGVFIQKYYNLPQTIQTYLDSDVKGRVNSIYQQKGIQYVWS